MLKIQEKKRMRTHRPVENLPSNLHILLLIIVPAVVHIIPFINNANPNIAGNTKDMVRRPKV